MTTYLPPSTRNNAIKLRLKPKKPTANHTIRTRRLTHPEDSKMDLDLSSLEGPPISDPPFTINIAMASSDIVSSC